MSVIGAMSVKIGADVSKLMAGAAVASGGLRSLTGVVSVLNSNLGRTAILSGAALIGLTMFAKGSTDQFIEFENALVRSTSVFGHLSKEMKEALKIKALDTLKQNIQAPEQIAEAYRFLGAAGFDAQESMKALDVVVDFATSGMFDLATATDLLTDAQSAMGLRTDDAAKNIENMTMMADLFVRAYTTANASIEQFSEAISNKAGASLRALNKDLSEGLAILSVFADSGTKGRQAGTQLAMVFDFMRKAAVRNQSAMRKWKVEIFDTSDEMKHMADIVENLESSIGHLGTKQKTMALLEMGFQARTQKTLNILIGKSDLIRRFEKRIKSFNMTSKQMAKIQRSSVANQIKITKNNIKALRIEFGEKFAPAVLRANKMVLKIVQTLTLIPSAVWGGVANIMIFTTSVIGLALVLGTLKIMFLTVLPIAYAFLNSIIVMASPFITIIALIAAVALGFMSIIGSGDTFVKRLSSGFNRILQEFIILVSTMGIMWEMLFGGFGDLMKVWYIGLSGELEKGLVIIFNFFQNFGSWIGWLKDNWLELAKFMYDAMLIVIKRLGKLFTGFGDGVKAMVEDLVSQVIESIMSGGKTPIEIRDFFGYVTDGLEFPVPDLTELPDAAKVLGAELDAINARMTEDINKILAGSFSFDLIDRIIAAKDAIADYLKDITNVSDSIVGERKAAGAFLKGSSEAHSILANSKNNAEDRAAGQRDETNGLLTDISGSIANLSTNTSSTMEIA